MLAGTDERKLSSLMNRSLPQPSPVLRPGGMILAGGRSLRMGRPKAWLKIDGRTLLETVVDSLGRGLAMVGPSPGGGLPPLLVVGAPGQALPALPPAVRRVDDAVEGRGPLQGIAAGLAALEKTADAVYVSSCDVPLLKPAFVRLLFALLGDAEVAVPLAGGRQHPLAAVYRPSLSPRVRSLLAAGERRPRRLFEIVRTRRVEEETLREVDPGLDSLRNLNTPAEYHEIASSTPQAPGGRRPG
ncbi:MAG: molybdenum cofactor guanylyltransferase [Acidobacteriota bacterium]